MGRSTHPWLSRARPGSTEPGSGSSGRIGFGPTNPIPIPGFLNLVAEERKARDEMEEESRSRNRDSMMAMSNMMLRPFLFCGGDGGAGSGGRVVKVLT
ncbi:hypothetical protein Taro_039467 [Colocasia esculenta]|uniref:Uncharacterized protein n=1 Tax=Colocasia esculenta TaxID=4460 RepID=A0A843WIY8_COLES|nr:hypothetical protein [Colocasia esculenta]